MAAIDTIYLPAEATSPWLLVGLHGWGANAEDLAALADYLPLSGFSMAFANAPIPHPQVPSGRMWYGFPHGYDFRQPPHFQDRPDLIQSRQLLRQWLLSLPEDTGIPWQRIVLLGFSQGGAMALDVGMELPLAGQIVLSGYLHGPLTTPVTSRPVRVIHGSHDPIVPVAWTREIRQALTAAAVPHTYVELPMGHEVAPEAVESIVGFCEDLT